MRGEISLNILILIVLGSLVIAIISLGVKNMFFSGKDTLEDVYLKSEEYVECVSYCLSLVPTEAGVCNVNGKTIMCSSILPIIKINLDSNAFKDKTLASLGVNPENLAYSIDDENSRCKIVDFLAIDKISLGDKTPNSRDVVRNVEKTIERYKTNIERTSQKYGFDPCLLVSTIAVESSGGDDKGPVMREGKILSCGITMINPKTAREKGICDTKMSDEECCNLLNDDSYAIDAGGKVIASMLNEIAKYAPLYPYDSDGVFKLAYFASYYNSGNACTSMSKTCSYSSCENLRKDNLLGRGKGIPKSLCAYNMGGCSETASHITKFVYAYKLCKEVFSS